MKRIITGIILIVLLSCNNESRGINSWAYQLQDADPQLISTTDFNLIVMDYSRDGTEDEKYTEGEIEKIKDAGIIPIVYISIGEAEDYRFYWKKEWKDNPPEWLGKENPEWEGNYKVKFWKEEWKNIIFSYLDRVIEQGFEGVYLDIIDAYLYWSDDKNGEDTVLSVEESASEMINFVKEISEYCRSKVEDTFYIIPQNGEDILDYDHGTYMETVSGIGIEDLFYNGTEKLEDEEIEERLKYLISFQKSGKLVLSVDYVDDGTGYKGENKDRIDDYIKKCRKYGFIPYASFSDRELNRLNIIEGVQPQ